MKLILEVMGEGASYASVNVDSELDYLRYLKDMITQVQQLKLANHDVYALELWHGTEYHSVIGLEPETPEELVPVLMQYLKNLEIDQWVLVPEAHAEFLDLDHARTNCETVKFTDDAVHWQANPAHGGLPVETAEFPLRAIKGLLKAKERESA